MTTSINLDLPLPDEFFSDILITAFDGSYGSSWNWFEPAVKDEDGNKVDWLNSDGDMWFSVRIRLNPECQTGDALWDAPHGYEITHASLAGAIQRIIKDDYIGVWRPATTSEEDAIDNDTLRREWRSVPTEHGTGYEVSTGETAKGLQSGIFGAVVGAGSEDGGYDFDADDADAIVQVAAFGKVIFG